MLKHVTPRRGEAVDRPVLHRILDLWSGSCTNRWVTSGVVRSGRSPVRRRLWPLPYECTYGIPLFHVKHHLSDQRAPEVGRKRRTLPAAHGTDKRLKEAALHLCEARRRGWHRASSVRILHALPYGRVAQSWME